MDNPSSLADPQAADRSFDEHIEHWAGEFQTLRRQTSNRRLLAVGALLLPGLLTCVLTMSLRSAGSWAPVIIFSLGATGTLVAFFVLLNKASGFESRGVQQMAGEIQETCEAEGLGTPRVVEALTRRAHPGGVLQKVLMAVDPDTVAILEIRKRGLQFFQREPAEEIPPLLIHVSGSSGVITTVTVKGEEHAERFRNVALDYLKNKAYVEAIAALAMVQAIYTDIAPPGGELMLQATPDSHPLKQTAISAQKIIGSFDLKPEMKAIREALIRRRAQSLLDAFLATQPRGREPESTSLAEETAISRPVTRDPVFVEACIRYLSERTKDLLKRNEIVEAMALIPDAEILPHLLDAFGWTFFFPRGIEAIALFGERAHAQLLDALSTGPARLRFNAALALGFMKAEAAKPVLRQQLPSVKAPTPRIGFYYALVRLGEAQWLDEIVAALDDPGDGVRHAAAIALEHLDEPLDDDVYLRHLNDESHLVRLRLIRKLGSQTTDSVALVDALSERLEDEEEPVRSAAADALAGLDAELVYDRMVGLAQSGGETAQVGACHVLGRLPSPEAVPLLLEMLQTSPSNDVRRAAISALGDLAAVDALGQVEPFLKVEELAHAAFWAILRIGQTDREAVVAALRHRRHKTKQLLLRALLGEKRARDELGQMLALHKDYRNLVEAMQLSFFLRDGAFEAPLRRLLTYRNPDRFPGDRYICHMAIKALVYIELAGQ